MMLDLSLCQERYEEIRRFSIGILGTKTREMVTEFKISRMVVVAASSLTIWGVLM